MWDQLTTFRSLDRGEKHYSLKEQPLNMPLGSQNPYAKRAYCGKRGHKKFECPNRVGRVTSPGRIGSPKVVGRVGEVECEMTIDSGALITMVRADLVREEDFTGELVTLKSVCGNSFTTRAAKHLGEYVVKHEVAVSEQLGEAVLLGMDLGLLNYLLQLEQQQRKQGVAVNAITRAQAKKQEEEARRDEELDAQDNALPKLLEFSVTSDAEVDAEQSFVVDVDDLDHAGNDSLHNWLGLMAYQERMVGHYHV